jgi:hypothetical protein
MRANSVRLGFQNMSSTGWRRPVVQSSRRSPAGSMSECLARKTAPPRYSVSTSISAQVQAGRMPAAVLVVIAPPGFVIAVGDILSSA